MNLLQTIFSTNFEPHYVHFINTPILMWMIIIGNAIIALAYYSIPISIGYFVRKRKDIPFNSIFWMFSAFIFWCGTTHIFHILIFFWPAYWLQAIVDMVTGIISIGTAIALWYLMPFIMKVPSITAIRDKNKELQKEILKRKRAEEEVLELNNRLEQKIEARNVELKKSEKRFLALYDSNLLGVFTASVKGKILDANDAFLHLINYSRKELQAGKIYWNKITPKEYHELDNRSIQQLENEGFAAPYEKEYIKKDGSQISVLLGRALLDQKKEQFIAFVLDITERKKVDQRKDEFIGIASHELKTPLTSIKGYVQILEKMIVKMDDDKAKILIGKTNTYIDKLHSLIADLLDVSKIQAGKLEFNYEEFNFDELVSESIDSIKAMSPRFDIICEECPHVTIIGDRSRLEQVFTNLLSNAVKYSPSANKIIVKTIKENEMLHVSITDFGIGISQAEQERLFKRFYRVDVSAKRFSGLGIGLYISYEIINRHGGKMWVESAKGKGSTFHFTIPINRT